jgi:LPXTG-motif cell wall-anchored protein
LQDGTFSLPVTVPGDLPAGSHTLQAEGLTTAGVFRAVSAGVIVSKDVVLPETGSQSDGWLIVGMIALIIGTVLVTRRRNLR